MPDTCVAISVIITTYRDPNSLRGVLAALTRQTRLPDEVIVADDGSPPDETLAALRPQADTALFPIIHVWQPDDGFRAARSRNNAVFHSRGRFLAFLDQDTLPHRSWLEAHHSTVTALQVGLGHVLDYPDSAADAITDIPVDQLETLHCAAAWKRLQALERKFRFYKGLRRLRLAPAHKPKLRSCNFSIHRSAYLAVNGFDERYQGWGQEDDDLGRRLYRAGIRPVILLTRAPVTHRRHPLRRTTDWTEGPNLPLYRQPIHSPRCDQGVSTHPHPDVRVTRLSGVSGT